jgi:hypothetical protein
MNDQDTIAGLTEREVLTVVDDTYGRALGPWCAPVEFEDRI